MFLAVSSFPPKSVNLKTINNFIIYTKRKDYNMNNKTKNSYIQICNAFKKLENLLYNNNYPELAIIINHLFFIWLKNKSSK